MKPETDYNSRVHVVQFANGKFRGDANTHVENISNATLYTKREAVAKASLYDDSVGATAVPFCVDADVKYIPAFKFYTNRQTIFVTLIGGCAVLVDKTHAIRELGSCRITNADMIELSHTLTFTKLQLEAEAKQKRNNQ